MKPQAAWLPDGRRLHLHHGPIDLIIGIDGPGRAAGFARARERFQTVLDELVAELPRLRRPDGPPPTGHVARRMQHAVQPFTAVFVTPMAAVAGAVADEILAAITAGDGIVKAHVNNGGDVAFHLGPGQTVESLIATDPPGRIAIRAGDPVRGIATSGWRGRSQSRGIADSVTVLASCAAAADAAATLIANAVDLPGHPAIVREPASLNHPDSDLGDRPVTAAVGRLSGAEIAQALDHGAAFAEAARTNGLIAGAVLVLAGVARVTGAVPALSQEEDNDA